MTYALIGLGFGCAVFVLALGLVYVYNLFRDWLDQ